jgi:hypothetical protein
LSGIVRQQSVVRQHSVVGLAIPPHEAIQVARRVLATEGYQSVAVGPTAATFVRDVRPQAVTIAAYAFAVPTLGLSLFGLLIRTQQQCTVTGETSSRGDGTALSLSGVVTTETLQMLERALQHAGQKAAVPSPDGAYNPFPAPDRDNGRDPFPFPDRDEVRSQFPSPDRDDDHNPFPSPARGREEPSPFPVAGRGVEEARVRFPVPGRDEPSGPDLLKRPRRPSAFPDAFAEPEPGGYSQAELEMTVVRANPLLAAPAGRADAEPGLPRWVLTLDDGRTIDVPDFALIGRDPEPTEDDPEAGLVSLVDPEMSVSKTHASFGVDDEGLWFLDRFSTNGTSLQLPGGERVGLEPGIATPVLPDSDVWIGRRHLKITLDD